MSQARQHRVAEAIKVELMDLLRQEVKDPRVGFVSIVRVEVSGDLRHARIFYSVLGDEDARQSSQAGLTKAAGFLRSQVAGRLNLRHAPELDFRLDDSIAHGAHIARLLNEVKAGESPKPEE